MNHFFMFQLYDELFLILLRIMGFIEFQWKINAIHTQDGKYAEV